MAILPCKFLDLLQSLKGGPVDSIDLADSKRAGAKPLTVVGGLQVAGEHMAMWRDLDRCQGRRWGLKDCQNI